MKPQWFVISAVLLFLAGCGEDSKNPLSDPQTSKPDERLSGVWRFDETYYHIGHAGKEFPKGVMRVVIVVHDQPGTVEPPGECLIFPTILGDKHYLNVVDGEEGKEQVKRFDEEGWKTDAVESYMFLKYQVDGDKMVVWFVDDKAKRQLIKDGKVKGVIDKEGEAKLTDTTENVVRFITDADDKLWDNDTPIRLERLKASKKP